MKYAREFKEHLLTEGFPPHWIDSAISYSQLKKCINRVQQELASIGLDAQTLQRLLQTVETQQQQQQQIAGETSDPDELTSPPVVEVEKPFEYRLTGSVVNTGRVKPKLLFVINAETGEPLDATLSPETRDYLQKLAINDRLGKLHIADDRDKEVEADDGTVGDASGPIYSASSESSVVLRNSSTKRRYIAVPLSSDSEFFAVLEREITGLAALQETERKKLTSEIEDLGKAVSTITRPRDSKSRTDLSRWRRIFEIYLESNIFFATNEQDHGVHSRAKAQKQWEIFLTEVQKAGLADHFRRKDNIAAIQKFMAINVELLQSLRFQEINQIAMNKILKSRYRLSCDSDIG